MGERVYAQKGDAVWTVLYIGNTAELTLPSGKVKLKEETKYPWDGDVAITVDPEKSFAFDLNLRVPGWCDDEPAVTVNGEKLNGLKAEKGYLKIARTWKSGDVVRLNLPMPVKRVYADPHVQADEGRVALQRGPVVYCLEGVDNERPGAQSVAAEGCQADDGVRQGPARRRGRGQGRGAGRDRAGRSG